MKGLEFKMIFGLIILIAVILLIAIIVFAPALGFGKTTQSRTKFEEFCVFWSLNNYKEGLGENVIVNGVNYGPPEQWCAPILGKLAITNPLDIYKCISCCKKEVAC